MEMISQYGSFQSTLLSGDMSFCYRFCRRRLPLSCLSSFCCCTWHNPCFHVLQSCRCAVVHPAFCLHLLLLLDLTSLLDSAGYQQAVQSASISSHQQEAVDYRYLSNAEENFPPSLYWSASEGIAHTAVAIPVSGSHILGITTNRERFFRRHSFASGLCSGHLFVWKEKLEKLQFSPATGNAGLQWILSSVIDKFACDQYDGVQPYFSAPAWDWLNKLSQ